jgi:serine/threonine protein kinase
MTQLGKYELLEKIGEGGYGIVYKARDPLLEREVAIKILRSDIASAPDFVERFRREARLAASLRHPNIVSVIEVGEQEGRYYLVMEYLEGEVLSALLKDGKPLPLKQTVEILQPLAEALDYAHGRGLVHRDVKPSNVILCDSGKRPVLTDFGLVKSMTESGLTTTGVSLGTVEYMAPEQILGQEPGPAADQYALGVVAYQMLTGKVPFGGTTPYAIQKGHAEQAIPDPRELNPQLPTQITEILQRALAKSASARYAKASEFITAMHTIVLSVSETLAAQALEEAQQLMEAHQFDDALDKLAKVSSIHTDERISLLQRECLRRKDVSEKYQALQSQIEKITHEIDGLIAKEKWLREVKTTVVPVPVEADPLPPQSPEKWDRATMIGYGIIMVAVLLLFIVIAIIVN